MNKSKIRLKAFMGYELRSAYHSGADFQKLGRAINKYFSSKSSGIHLDFEYGKFPPGTQLWEQVRQSINKAHVTVFDISENNPNVLLEAGIAIGTDKHVIFLKSADSKSLLPTDLNSFLYVEYKSKEKVSQKSVVGKVSKSIEYYLKHGHGPHLYYRLLWSLNPSRKTLIIPGKLPEKYADNRFEDYIRLREYGDLDAIYTVSETIHRLYPQTNVEILPAKRLNDLPKDWGDCNLIFIGGPDFNPVVRHFEDLCSLKYEYGPGDDDIWLRHKKTGKIYKPRFYSRHGEPHARDYGFFLKIGPGRKHPTARIFMGGIRTWGVFGAAMLVGCTSDDQDTTSHDNVKKLVTKFGSDPSLLVPVTIRGTKDSIQPPTWNWKSIEVISA